MSRIDNSDIEAALQAEHIDYTVLVSLDLSSGTQRLHIGRGQITVDGQVWSGMGEFSSVSAVVERPDGRDYSQLVLGLNGVDPSLLSLVPDRTEYINRAASLYVVPFNVSTGVPIEPIEAALFEGFMDFMSYERQSGGASISVTVKHQDCLYSETIGLMYNDEHQQMLYSGDQMCDLIPAMMNSEISWGGGRVAHGVTDVRQIRTIGGAPAIVSATP
jgi:hypothetical protein